MKKEKQEKAIITEFLNRRSTIIFLLCLICVIGLPLRVQNIKLNGYISDDAWWHYRHIETVVETGHRLNPDIYEFTTLGRPMTYPPLFHYLIGFTCRLFSRFISLITFTHYFNIIEAFIYLFLIYALANIITQDRLFSLLGTLAASVSYGMIIRARAGELMPFVLADLLSLTAILIIFINSQKRSFVLSVVTGILFGLSMLAWSGTALIYLPFILFMFLAIAISNPKFIKSGLNLSLLCLISMLVVCLPWYLPLILKYGINPHSSQMQWFMKNFTVLHQRKPLNFHILTSGISIFFIPVAFLGVLFKRDAKNILFLLWIILGAVATYIGWRGYVAVVPIVSAISLSIGLSMLVRFFFKQGSRWKGIIFIVLFLILASVGLHISQLRIRPLNPKDTGEVRTNEKSIKMLEFLRNNFPGAVAIDHITWVSEDAAVGKLKMVNGQYLEYLPEGSSQILKDVSKVYVSSEEEAYKICQKYGADLIIVRKQFLLLAQLSILFAPPELNSEEYLKVTKEFQDSTEITISFTPKGMQTIMFRMLNRQPLDRFELVYADQDPSGPIPFLVVYKVKKGSLSKDGAEGGS